MVVAFRIYRNSHIQPVNAEAFPRFRIVVCVNYLKLLDIIVYLILSSYLNNLKLLDNYLNKFSTNKSTLN